MNNKPFTVYLIDDNEAFRESTRWVLEADGAEVVDYPSAETFLAALDRDVLASQIPVVLSDLRMPEMSGLELIEELKRQQYRVPVVFITGHGDVPLAVEAMRRGAANFLEKPVEDQSLIEVMRLAAWQPGAQPRDPDAAAGKLARLTPREYQVMELVCSGKLNKTIADVLDISIKTVELHRANMMEKLEVRNVPDLIHTVLGYR